MNVREIYVLEPGTGKLKVALCGSLYCELVLSQLHIKLVSTYIYVLRSFEIKYKIHTAKKI